MKTNFEYKSAWSAFKYVRGIYMSRYKLNYRFHNPNPTSEMAEYLARVFLDVNAKKVEDVIHSKL